MRENLTDITIVLDRSGSMNSIANDVIGGLNKFIADQGQAPGDCNLTVVQFDHEYGPIAGPRPIRDFPPYTAATYAPRGATALLDAMGRTLVETGQRLEAMPEADRPGKVVFAVMTDGLENSSKEYSRDRVNQMIQVQQEQFNWQVVFLGANQDAIQAGGSLGVAAASSMTFAGNSGGIGAAVDSLSVNTTNFRMGRSKGMDFSDEDRQEQRRQGANC